MVFTAEGHRSAPRRTPALVLDGPDRVARTAAELLINRLQARPRLRLLLATGGAARTVYEQLRGRVARTPALFAGATLLQLGEYCGPHPEHPGSLRSELRRELPFDFELRHELAGEAFDPEGECVRYERLLHEAPLDLAVVELGPDGEVAFNEPGATLASRVRRVALGARTRAEAARSFGSSQEAPSHALSVGLANLLAAREVVLIAIGADRAYALAGALTEPPTNELPASLLTEHPYLTVISDRAAGRLL